MGEVVPLGAIKRTRPGPARLAVHAALRGAIIRGELEPGRQLSENALAAELGVSRTPVREALASLREDRLVEIVPQLGSFVSRISPQAIGDAQFIREALECAAIARGAELASTEQIAELHQNLDSQARAAGPEDPEAFYQLDDGFHRMLCDLSGHPTVAVISDRARSHLARIRRLSLGMPGYLVKMLEEHRAVAGAVAARDPEAAEELLRHHLRMVLGEIPRIREAHPGYFEGW